MPAKVLVAMALASVVLAGLYMWLAPQPARPAATPESARARAPAPEARQFDLVVRGGKRVEGPAVLAVTQGERVIVNVLADSADEMHLHGYDLHAGLRPNETAALTFTADRAGRFELELHRAHVALAALEVQPR
jgi:hypothetical protein